jgi:sn-glycerol 3-phosphate transport system permease protein
MSALGEGPVSVIARPRVDVDTGAARSWARLTRSRPRWPNLIAHAILVAAVAIIAFPLYYAFVISTQTLDDAIRLPPRLLPGTALVENYARAWSRAGMGRLLVNSAVMALGVAIGKIVISLLSAFAIVYFNFRGKQLVFWMIFVTLMLPVPVRIVSTYEVISRLGWVNTYWGLTVPLMASATGTFLFRQFYQTIPDSLAEAAQLDGAGPLRFLWSILLPLSKANIAALFVILFVYGWNEYLWPLMITTTQEMRTAVVGVEALVPRGGSQLAEWNIIMAAAMMVLLPPVAVIVVMQRWFVKGLIETEK